MSVSVTVANTGSLDGNEASQLYVQFLDSADEPVRQLRGFERTIIQAERSSTVVFSLRRRDLSVWDVAAQELAIVSRAYVFSVGASSRDLRLSQIMAGLGA